MEDDVEGVSAIGEETGLGVGGRLSLTVNFTIWGDGGRFGSISGDTSLLAESGVVRLGWGDRCKLGDAHSSDTRGCMPGCYCGDIDVEDRTLSEDSSQNGGRDMMVGARPTCGLLGDKIEGTSEAGRGEVHRLLIP